MSILIAGVARTPTPPIKNYVPDFPIWKSQASTRRGAMHWPPPEGTTFLIMVSPAQSKLRFSRSSSFIREDLQGLIVGFGFKMT